MQLTKRRLGPQIAIALLLTALAIGVVIKMTWQDDSWAVLRSMKGGPLWAAVSLVFIGWIVDGWRMQAMTRALGYKIPFRTAVRTNVLGYFLSAITPFTAGGGALQVYSLSRAGLTVGHGTATVLVSGFISQFGLALAGVIIVFGFGVTAAADPRLEQLIRIGVIVYMAVVVALVWLSWHIDKGRKLAATVVRSVLKFVADDAKVQRAADSVDKAIVDIHHGLQQLFGRRSPWAFVGALLSVVFYSVQFAIIPVIALGFGIAVSFPLFMAVQVPIYLLASILPTPGGSGGLEFGVAGALLQFVPASEMGVLVVAWRIITFYLVLAVGAFAAVAFARFEFDRVAAAREEGKQTERNEVVEGTGPDRVNPPEAGGRTRPTRHTPSEPPRGRAQTRDTAAPSTVRRTRSLGQY